ncbi:glycosyltransferase family 4 protein [Klebsiella grimontii]|uniref:glycosyltransferase family 4 protein n=1 Tax=Klebsiella grimontii TaxID=2058152 RepID=UPI0012B94777|nr:glycosyltransferase family 4 protein [Klebsiella grimontii]MDT8626255.1 glycosyltransferase family 4 protein [Klebsiella grimontii]UNF14505.1 glycosyltransferase family 4 protein [Klebsiella grimontii]
MEKVIIFTNEFYPFKGGIGRYCEELIVETIKIFQVTLVAPKYDGSFLNNDLAEHISINFVEGGQFKYWHLPKLIKKVLSIDFTPYDHVLIADWPFWVAIEFVNKYVPWKAKIRYSLMLHGSEVLNLKNGRASIFPKFIDLFGGARNIYTNSQYTKNILRENHNVPPTIPVEVTYLGVSQTENPSNENYIANVRNEKFQLLSVGRLDDRKGFDNVIKAIGLLDEAVKSKIYFTIVGNGSREYKEFLNDLAKKNIVNLNILSGLNDNELNKCYNKTNLFILAARNNNKKIEGFGLVFLEAAKFGVPSIATDVGAISEVVKNNQTGFVVKEDIHELKKAIYNCYIDRNILIEFSKNCVSNVKEFKWSTLANKTFPKTYGSKK